MRFTTRYGTALLLGATLAACGGNKDNATTDQAGGEPAAATTTGDSAGALGAPGAAPGAAGDMTALTGMSAGDQLAVINASNATEIVTSRAAQPKLTNADARSFANDMIREHTAMQGQADQLAKAANITPGSPELAEQKTTMGNQMAEQLNTAAQGAALDRQYIDGQVTAHQQTLEQLQALQNASDSTVKAVATQALPKVQAHLERARRIQQGLGGADSAGAMGAAGAAATRP